MQNESKTVDGQHPIGRATNSLKKEKDGYEEINPEPAKRKLQSNFCNGNATEICKEEQRHHEDCASNQPPLGPIELEQSHATEFGMDDLEQRQNEDCIPNPSPLGPSEPKHNGIGTRHYEPNLPEFDFFPSEIKDKMWGSISQRSFCDDINKIYDEIVHFRRNIFNIPSGREGKNFNGELTFSLKQFNSNSDLNSIALKAFMLLPSLIFKSLRLLPRVKNTAQR
ncbi:Hypothetical predicted protein [Paramuricea clavata]|uniref:Uncharacterized protein n=1 Tax=Paramuricea clavata TaxID=317549 RepID=A0A7D9M1W3_PARCT|nr:Hypothetical predicted protein [Paramuricea clavata]